MTNSFTVSNLPRTEDYYLLNGLFRGHVTTRTKAMCWHITVNVEAGLLAELQLHERPRLQFATTMQQTIS